MHKVKVGWCWELSLLSLSPPQSQLMINAYKVKLSLLILIGGMRRKVGKGGGEESSEKFGALIRKQKGGVHNVVRSGKGRN